MRPERDAGRGCHCWLTVASLRRWLHMRAWGPRRNTAPAVVSPPLARTPAAPGSRFARSFQSGHALRHIGGPGTSGPSARGRFGITGPHSRPPHGVLGSAGVPAAGSRQTNPPVQLTNTPETAPRRILQGPIGSHELKIPPEIPPDPQNGHFEQQSHQNGRKTPKPERSPDPHQKNAPGSP